MAEHPSSITETAIPILAKQTAASLAASALLSCMPPPAFAAQAGSRQAEACAAAGRPCPAASAAARVRPKPQPACGRLREAIVEAEQSERRVRATMMESVQLDLLSLRKRYRKLGCRAATRN